MVEAARAAEAGALDVSRRLRVLLVTETYDPEIGGGERQARQLAHALVHQGHRVTVLTRRSRRGTARAEEDEGVQVRRVGPSGRGRWKKWGLLLTVPAAQLRAGPQDVVLVSGYRTVGLAVVPLARVLGQRSVLKADSAGEMSGVFFEPGLATWGLSPRSPIIRWLVSARNRVLRRADAFVAMSTEIAAELHTCGVPADRVHRIPNGVDTTRFRPAAPAERIALRRRLSLPEGPIITYTGRLVSYKGLPLLMQAWRAVKAVGAPGTLVLVGEGGSDMHACEAALRREAAEAGLGGSVVFTGAVDNVDEYLRASDAFVFPTQNEAFGLSLVEAMACGLPVAATRVGAAIDVIVNGQNGWLLEPGHAQQLQDVLRRFCSGQNGVEAMGMAARATAVARFSTEAVADRYLALFKRLTEPATLRKAS